LQKLAGLSRWEMNSARPMVFKYAFDAGLIDRPVKYWPIIQAPCKKKVLRLARAAKGPPPFDAKALRQIINAADVQLRAMILLASIAEFGNNDVGHAAAARRGLEGAG